MDTIVEFFTSILLFLDSIIYSLINWVYQIILVLCEIDILNNSYEIDALMNRLYVIIGVVVLFLVAYSLLKSMVNPDDALKNKKGPVTIIRDVIISVVLIALVPSIFSFAMDFQFSLLRENTVGKLILGTSSVDDTNDISDGGMVFATNVLQAFLHPDFSQCILDREDYSYDCSNYTINTAGIGIPFLFSWPTESTNYDDMWNDIIESENMLGITSFAYPIAHDGNMTYYWGLSTVAGVIVLIVLVLYCIDVAIRVVKLAVYELIAPLPILLRIIPNEQGNKVFSNWIKATLSTYLEVFIRLAILFFGVLLTKIIVQNFTSLFAPLVSGSAGFTVVLFAQMFLIVGIILFIKQAPQILKDITGLDSGKYGKSFIKGIGILGASVGGGATAAIRSFASDTQKGVPLRRRFGRSLTAGLSGGARGAWQGRKTEKLGDITKNAGSAATSALSGRARRENAGGWGAYLGQQGAALMAKGKDWLNVEDSDRVQEFASNLDKDVTQSQGVYKKSQDYIDAKALLTKLKNSIKDYDQAWNNILLEAQNDERTKDPTKDDYISVEELAQQKFIQRFGKSIDAMHTELNAANNTVEEIKKSESKKKATTVAAGARDFAFQLQRFSDLDFDVESAIRTKLPNNSAEAQRLISAYNNYNEYNENPDALYERLTLDLQSSDDNVVQNALDYIDALDMAKNHALDMQSSAAFRKTVFKAKVKDAGGDGNKK